MTDEEDIQALFAADMTGEMMALGVKCKLCSVEFEKAHGYPVVCHTCARDRDDDELLDAEGAMSAMYREVDE